MFITLILTLLVLYSCGVDTDIDDSHVTTLPTRIADTPKPNLEPDIQAIRDIDDEFSFRNLERFINDLVIEI